MELEKAALIKKHKVRLNILMFMNLIKNLKEIL